MQSVSSDYFDYYFGWENSRQYDLISICDCGTESALGTTPHS